MKDGRRNAVSAHNQAAVGPADGGSRPVGRAGGCRQGENPADVSPETSLSGESRPEDSSTGDASPGGEASGGSVPDDSRGGEQPPESRLPDGSSPGGPSSGNPSSGIPSSDDPASSTPSPDNPASQITLETSTTVLGPAARSAGQDRGQTPNRAELRRVGRLVVYRYR